MNSVPPFLDADAKADLKAHASLPFIVPTFFAEYHVCRCIFVYLTMIARQIVFFPIDLITKRKYFQKPQYKYSLCIFICWLITFLIPVVFNIPFELSLQVILGQSFYKIWKFYTLMFILQRFLTKVQLHTHRVLRGAIWQEKSVIGPIILHTICNILVLIAYNLYFGAYLAGLYGKKGLFISACLHIQALVAKKFLPKVLDYPPYFTMPIDRLVILFSILVHLRNHHINKVIALIEFEYGFAFIKFFLVAISDECVGMHKALSSGADNAFIKFFKGEQSIADSIMVGFPIEVFSAITLLLIVKGPVLNSICIGAGVLCFAFLGTIVCNIVGKRISESLPKDEAPVSEDKKNELKPEDGEKKKSD